MCITVSGHRAYVDGAPVAYRDTPNKSGTIVPEGIILHDTAGGLGAEGSISWLCNPDAKASAHVVIGRDGEITQLAPFIARAWHAGKSSYNGRPDVNSFAIGIEIVNPGLLKKDGDHYVNDLGVRVSDGPDVMWRETKEHGAGYWLSYTAAQVLSVTELCRALAAAYPTITWISTHWSISPGRKIDTNPLFPLDEVRAEVFGRPAAPAPAPVPAAAAVAGPFVISSIKDVQVALTTLGYDLGPAGADGIAGPLTRAAVKAFQAVEKLDVDGIAGPKTKAALAEALKRAGTTRATAAALVGFADFGAGPPPIDLFDGSQDTVKMVQQRLRDLGYAEVGNVDGELGPRARAGILAFRNDNRLPLTPSIDPDLLIALQRAAPRPIAETRAGATVAEVAAKVPAVAAARAASALASAQALGGAGFAALLAIADNITAVRERLAPLQELLTGVPPSLWGLLVAGGAVALWLRSRQAVTAGAQDYRDAKRM